jgi:tetratricopeptide (TPR) repeat protein
METLGLPGAAAPTSLRAKALAALAGITYWQTDYATAGPAYEEALSIYRALGDDRGVIGTLYSLAYIRGTEHDFGAAEGLARESGELAERTGDRLGMAFARQMVGAMEARLERFDVGLEDSQAATRVFRELGERFGLGNALHLQSSMYRETGRFADAHAASEEAIAIFRGAGSVAGTAMALGGMAALMIAQGDVEDGVRVGGAADAMEEAVGGRAPTALRGYEDARDLARPLIGDEATMRAWHAGRALSFDEAMALVREGPAG